MPREGAKSRRVPGSSAPTGFRSWFLALQSSPRGQSSLARSPKIPCRIGATCVRQTSRIREHLAPRSTLAKPRLAHRMVAASNGVEVSNGVKASSFEYKGWRFDSVSGPILSTCERGTLTDKLSATAASKGLPSIVPPLPEAIFGHSYLTMTHEASGRTFSFDAAGAIACWMRESAHKGSGGVRVTTASLPSWKKVADEQDLAMGASDYDWTFSTDYSGTTGAESPLSPTTEVEGAPAQWGVHTGSGLDMALLRRRDIPILHFVDLTLYEDDLGDNGESVVRLRMRVMPSCFLLLLRHALRVPTAGSCPCRVH